MGAQRLIARGRIDIDVSVLSGWPIVPCYYEIFIAPQVPTLAHRHMQS